MYCGQLTGRVRKGEHIIPQAIGGVRSIKDVCAQCNNNVLSGLDNELCTASPVAIIAKQILGKGIGQIWDVDHRNGNVLLEAEPNWAEQSMTIWPQIICTSNGTESRGDYEELLSVGQENFHRIFVKHMRCAYWRWKSTGKGLFFKPLRSAADILKTYRYPPRVYAERRIKDFGENMTFILGYVTENDKRQVLHMIDQWDMGGSFKRLEVERGSYFPAVRRYWDIVKVLRGLTKMGINLLRDTCEFTIVNRDSFPAAIGFVMGGAEPSAELFGQNGFVWPADLSQLHREDDGHAFRLLHDRGFWRLLCSFFGGRVCATVRFPGPCSEKWKTVDIATPLAANDRDASREWLVARHSLLLPLRCHVEWNDPNRVVPSVAMLNTRYSIDIQQSRD